MYLKITNWLRFPRSSDSVLAMRLFEHLADITAGHARAFPSTEYPEINEAIRDIHYRTLVMKEIFEAKT